MKKYIKPELQVVIVETEKFICVSMGMYDEEVMEQGARGNGLWDDDEE